MDAAYDLSSIHDYVLGNTHAIPVIDTNRRRGIIPDNLTFNRKRLIITKEGGKSRYELRWGIEGTFPLLGRYCIQNIYGMCAAGTMMLLLVKELWHTTALSWSVKLGKD